MVMRIAFQAAMRAAAITLLTDYKASTSGNLQIYPGRPASIYPPTAFPDAVNETTILTGPKMRQRTVRVELIVIHGLFDSAEAVAQKDIFVDGFMDWVTDRYHAAGAATLISQISSDDIPFYIPEWLPPDKQRAYYATQINLEGYANG